MNKYKDALAAMEHVSEDADQEFLDNVKAQVRRKGQKTPVNINLEGKTRR